MALGAESSAIFVTPMLIVLSDHPRHLGPCLQIYPRSAWDRTTFLPLPHPLIILKAFFPLLPFLSVSPSSVPVILSVYPSQIPCKQYFEIPSSQGCGSGRGRGRSSSYAEPCLSTSLWPRCSHPRAWWAGLPVCVKFQTSTEDSCQRFHLVLMTMAQAWGASWGPF